MLVIGHRGTPAYAAENTLSSFKKAVEFGVEMIELDIYVCATGELVVMHDDRINRTTNGKGFVFQKTLEELKSYTVMGGDSIPTLKEVFDLLDGRIELNIELKGQGTAKALRHFLHPYLPGSPWRKEQLLISSFDLQELAVCKELQPDLRLGALEGGVPLDVAGFAAPLEPWSLHFHLEYIRESIVREAHAAGFKVLVYTVDFPEDLIRLEAMGVDGIFTNDPPRVTGGISG